MFLHPHPYSHPACRARNPGSDDVVHYTHLNSHSLDEHGDTCASATHSMRSGFSYHMHSAMSRARRASADKCPNWGIRGDKVRPQRDTKLVSVCLFRRQWPCLPTLSSRLEIPFDALPVALSHKRVTNVSQTSPPEPDAAGRLFAGMTAVPVVSIAAAASGRLPLTAALLRLFPCPSPSPSPISISLTLSPRHLHDVLPSRSTTICSQIEKCMHDLLYILVIHEVL